MPNFIETQPPLEGEDLTRWLNELQRKVNIALERTGAYPPRYVLPNKPKDGDIYYFGAVIGTDITAIGFWGRKEGAWVQIA